VWGKAAGKVSLFAEISEQKRGGGGLLSGSRLEGVLPKSHPSFDLEITRYLSTIDFYIQSILEIYRFVFFRESYVSTITTKNVKLHNAKKCTLLTHPPTRWMARSSRVAVAERKHEHNIIIKLVADLILHTRSRLVIIKVRVYFTIFYYSCVFHLSEKLLFYF
jgi:hypothetical protein